jgi:hypothetical protein
MSGPLWHPDRGPTVLIVVVTTLAVATLFVAARMVSRLAIVRQITWDDYMIILSWVIAFGSTFAIAFGTSKGLGRRDVDIRQDSVVTLKKCEYVFAVLYVC